MTRIETLQHEIMLATARCHAHASNDRPVSATVANIHAGMWLAAMWAAATGQQEDERRISRVIGDGS